MTRTTGGCFKYGVLFFRIGEFFIIYFLHKEAPKLVSLLMFIILGLVSFVVFAIEI